MKAAPIYAARAARHRCEAQRRNREGVGCEDRLRYSVTSCRRVQYDTPPETSVEGKQRKRQCQRQREALALKTAYAQTDGAVAVATTVGAYAAVCTHVVVVACGAWLLTRGGPLRGASLWSQIGAGCLMVDAFLCAFLMPVMLRAARDNSLVRAVLIASAAAVALTALPTVVVSLFGDVAALPFRHILYTGKGGLWMLALLWIIAIHGVVSVWLAWRLATHPAHVLPGSSEP